LKAFNSRARHGQLKKLDLIWRKAEFGDLIRGHTHNTGTLWFPKEGKKVADLLETLRGDGRWEFERSMKLVLERNLSITRSDQLVEDLHLAFGGRFLHNEKVLWEDFVKRS